MFSLKQQLKKNETLILSVILYAILLVYIYQFMMFVGKYKTSTTDEMFYYIEAKAISAHNIYQTPASLDGNTSYIGDFGFHGVSYALKDGWLAKFFFQSENPPLLWNNVFVCLLTITLILLAKQFSLNIRLNIALVVATHYMMYMCTLSYMQETIHYFLATIAIYLLYHVYQNTSTKKYLYYFLLVIVIAITFRYGWFIWGLGLLPLAKDFKTFFKWGLITTGLLLFGVFISRYIAAPYPYDEMVADRLIRTEEFSIFNSVKIILEKFFNNLQVYITPSGIAKTTTMRYLLLALLFTNTVFAIVKRNRFIIACTLISWGYFFSALAFYHVYWSYDERVLAVLNPLLAFSLIGVNNKLFFYPIIAVQLFLFPSVIRETEQRNLASISANVPTPEYIAIKNSYEKIKDLITDDTATTIAINIILVRHGAQDYFMDFPLVNSKGHPIHYRIFREGNDLRGTHIARYFLNPDKETLPSNCELIYSDSWMNLYRKR